MIYWHRFLKDFFPGVNKMGVPVDSSGSISPQQRTSRIGEDQKQAVLLELDSILKSQAFRGSKRCKEFLSFVVENSLQGHGESLKERTIGVELFHRLPSYNTGEDPVVRVKAGDVRKRLAQYYGEEAATPEVRIDIPVGAYIPEFHWNSKALLNIKEEGRVPVEKRSRLRNPQILFLGLVFVLASAIFVVSRKTIHPSTVMVQFWKPLFSTSQPILICLAAPVVYFPSMDLYRRASASDQPKYKTMVERFNTILRLAPDASLQWKDMVPQTNSYVNKEDADAAAKLSALFDSIHKPSQIRIGDDFSFADLRNSPAVLVGAFNNRWALQMTANLGFSFVDDNGVGKIEEQEHARRVWQFQAGSDGQTNVDYALVSRLFDSKTGQLLIVAAGIGASITQAAGEFLSHEEYLAEGLASAPKGWQEKDLQVVLQTNITDGVAGPPRVLATHFW